VRALVIDDDVSLAERLRSILERRKFAVETVSDGDAGITALMNSRFDIVIIEAWVSRCDGFTVTCEARAAGIQTPILMLGARDTVADRVRGLDSGADDFMTKPVQEDELLARLRALLRRGPAPLRELRAVGDLVLDSAARTVAVGELPVQLASTEFRLLEYFVTNPGIVLSRDQILEFVWGSAFDGSRNIVEFYVCALRRKLRPVNARARLVTVRGFGYKLIA
jgi:two-component system OmpR family response regulator